MFFQLQTGLTYPIVWKTEVFINALFKFVFTKVEQKIQERSNVFEQFRLVNKASSLYLKVSFISRILTQLV